MYLLLDLHLRPHPTTTLPTPTRRVTTGSNGLPRHYVTPITTMNETRRVSSSVSFFFFQYIIFTNNSFYRYYCTNYVAGTDTNEKREGKGKRRRQGRQGMEQRGVG